MTERNLANKILTALLKHLDATDGQAFFESLSHQNRYFRDTTETSIRRQFLAELGVREPEVATLFIESLAHDRNFADIFDLPTNSAALTNDELEELLVPEGDFVPTWPNLRDKYPTTRGIIALGMPILNDRLDIATMYVGQTFAPKMGHGRIHVFRKQNDIWSIDTERMLGIWVS